MAKRVVVFENPAAAPAVVVRRKRDAQAARAGQESAKSATGAKTAVPRSQTPAAGPKASALAAEAPKAPRTPSQDRQGVVFTTPKVIVKGTPQSRDAKAAKAQKTPGQPKTAKKKKKTAPQEIFKETYLAELGEALARSRAMLADDAVENKDYYRDKSAFLAKLADYFDNGAQPEFEALDEPFFWNEFFVIVTIFAKKRPENCGKLSWGKQTNAIIKTLLEFYNGVRAKRDKYVLKRYPKFEADVVFNFCGSMLYIKKSMGDAEAGGALEELLARYNTLFVESNIGKLVMRMACKLHRMKEKEGFSGWKLWNNMETLEYVYNLLPEAGANQTTEEQ